VKTVHVGIRFEQCCVRSNGHSCEQESQCHCASRTGKGQLSSGYQSSTRHWGLCGLRAAATTATNRDALDHLTKAYGPEVVRDALNKVVKNLLPNKTLQRVKRYLRREARKPVDMSVKQHIMHIYCISTEEIARCPPAFDQNQCLSDDEIIDRHPSLGYTQKLAARNGSSRI